ncbi:single-stranded DNA-binding protein [Micrococcus sp. TA1]|uniref:single-stranded DNA-binding protein n=1 Tax=Micrococcus sp. TA1 TaxID=681627 RepID=UPI00351BF44B
MSFKGNVGKVRGLAFSNDGKPRFSFSVAEGHSKPNGNGGFDDIGTTWWNVTVFGKQAEDLADIVAEGQKQRVVVAGRSSTREYEANGETRTSLDVIADNVGVVHRAPQGQQQGQPAQQQPWGGQQQAAPNWGVPQGGGPAF